MKTSKTGNELPAYRIPGFLRKYYSRVNLFTQKTRFQKEVSDFLKQCQMDQNNTDFMNHRICTICDIARQELEEQHIQNQRKIALLEANQQARIDNLDIQIQELEMQIQELENQLAQEGVNL